MTSPFLKDLRRYLRDACSEELESLSTQLGVSSDKELARCLNTNVRKIRDIRHSGSLCALTELCEKVGIKDITMKERECCVGDSADMSPQISELYSIKTIEKIKHYCPFCKKTMQTWHIGRNGKQVASPPEPLIIDGDTVYGVDTGLTHTTGWTEDDPCYWGLELLRPCASCKKEGFFVFANCMSKKYTFKAYQDRLMFNTQVGDPAYIKANLNQHAMHHIDSWHITEYKTDTLPPMQAHRVGPFKIQNISNIKGPYGVQACAEFGDADWQHARTMLVTLFPYFGDIAERQNQHWLQSQGQQELV